MQCTVITTSRSSGIAHGLTYAAGPLSVEEGSHVLIPLRKKMIEGIVVAVEEEKAKNDFKLKEIKKLLHEKPLLTKTQIQTALWMSEKYCCTLRQALSPWLPGSSWSELQPREIIGHQLIDDHANVRGTKQQAVIETLRGKEWMSKEELQSLSGASAQTLRALIEKGIIEEVVRRENAGEPITNNQQLITPNLTKDQAAAYQSIKKESRHSLLFGITGSGKTEIYAQMIADAVKQGKQAILLVPEILLTEHSIHRFEELFEDHERISIMHSRLTPAQRRAEWRRVHQGQVDLVIGSRSALFAPAPDLGLIIIDEEHEWTYKNEQTPRYHARDVAEKLAELTGAKLLLGTATPSLESWAKTKSGAYHLATLPKRYKDQALPDVRVVDLAEVQFGDLYPFSPALLSAIEDRLKRGEQSVLFLNRRGVATALLCLSCRRRIVSPESNLPFTVHRNTQGNPYLLDHISGMQADVPQTCPHCDSASLRFIGAGTQKVEEILQQRFPEARLLRADSDTLTHPEKMRLLLKKMREGSADILLGTQSVTKGLDLPNVTLAAVILADVGLSLPHFRAGERIFQLLTQLTGRSGRAKPGDVIIQTFRPDAPEIKFAANHETEVFLEQELKLRLHAKYPPATNMVRFLVRSGEKRATQLHHEIEAYSLERSADLIVQSAPLLFGGGREWHVLVRGTHPEKTVKAVNLTDVVVDIDPIECI